MRGVSIASVSLDRHHFAIDIHGQGTRLDDATLATARDFHSEASAATTSRSCRFIARISIADHP
jgi:hypothetical protein